MTVLTEELSTISSSILYSSAHYYVQNGDIMADPEMDFFKSPINELFYPIFDLKKRELNINLLLYVLHYSNSKQVG